MAPHNQRDTLNTNPYKQFAELISHRSNLFGADLPPEADSDEGDADRAHSRTLAEDSPTDATSSSSDTDSIGSSHANGNDAVVRRTSSVKRRHQDRRQGRLLLVSMLENFCALYDESPERNRRLFYVICKQLHSMGILNQDDFLDELSTVRGSYKRAFRDLVVRAMDAIRDQDLHNTPPCLAGETSLVSGRSSPHFPGSGVSPLIPHGSPAGRSFASVWDSASSRYEEDFQQMQLLGKGAFGRVYRALNRLDGSEYAIKKIRLKMGSSTLERILREVKFQARLQHPNVVRYFASWVEDLPPDDPHRRAPPPERPGPIRDGRLGLVVGGGGPLGGQTSFRRYQQRITELHTDVSDEDGFDEPSHTMEPSESGVEIVFADTSNDGVGQGMLDDDKRVAKVHHSETTNQERPEAPEEDSANLRRVTGDNRFFASAAPSDADTGEIDDYSIDSASSVTMASTLSKSGSNFDSSNRVHNPSPLSSSLHSVRPHCLTLLIQMELCSDTLQDFIRARNQRCAHSATPLDERAALVIFRDIVHGLLYVHAMGCIHRDIKPKNIYWKADTSNPGSGGAWKIGDFGLVTASDIITSTAEEPLSTEETSIHPLAKKTSSPPGSDVSLGEACWNASSKRSHSAHSDRTANVGTFTYASPEQLAPTPSIPYTPASDMYSLGIILFELLYPFSTAMERARTLQQLRASNGAEPVPASTSDSSMCCAQWIPRLMQERPEARPSAADLCTFLAAAEPKLAPHHHHYVPRTTLQQKHDSGVVESLDASILSLADTSEDSSAALHTENVALRNRVEELERRLQILGVTP
ncbi:Eukaryotic translation initiation factor 2-alpha kinase [Thoreauomyces humboldtii]|nr:Eukaryotic translation initiation factor 2-alpha kinase [Thoreauomyces humboldtii]